MREAAIRKRLLKDGWMAPNHLVVHLMRPPSAREDVTYADVMGFQRVSGLATPREKANPIETIVVRPEVAAAIDMAASTITGPEYEGMGLKLDLIDVLRVTR